MDRNDAMLIGFCVLCFTLLLLGVVYINYHLDEVYIKNGYTRKTLQGSGVTHWVKY